MSKVKILVKRVAFFVGALALVLVPTSSAHATWSNHNESFARDNG